MKKVLCFILAVLLLVPALAAAESGTLMCLGCKVNGETVMNIDGPVVLTAIADAPAVSAWKVNGTVVEGENNIFLIFTADGNTVVEAVAGDAASAAAQTPAAQEASARPVVIKAVGATLQLLDTDGNPGGEKVTELDFTNGLENPVSGDTEPAGFASFRVTADDPHNGKIAYWIINGTKFTFNNTVKYITVLGLAESMTFEVVYNYSSPTTMWQYPEADGRLIASVQNAKMRFVNGSQTGGENMSELDFTDSYKNAASGEVCPGGKVNLKVYFDGSETTIVQYWQINGAVFLFNSEIRAMYLRDLGQSMDFLCQYKGAASSGSSGSSNGGLNLTPIPRDPSLNIDPGARKRFDSRLEDILNGILNGSGSSNEGGMTEIDPPIERKPRTPIN